MFEGQSIRLEMLSEDIAELCFDRRGEAFNKLDVRTVNELSAATDTLQRQPGVKGVLVTSAKNGFIVGADIFEFSSLFARSQSQITAHIAGQNAVFRRFEDLDLPIVTAINGVALGGGLEMALASDYRVIAATAQVGLPEVKLGLFPGYGGTVRLPRLAGCSVAVEWISTGKPRTADEAVMAGVADEVVAADGLRAAGMMRLRAAVGSGEWRARRVRRQGPFVSDSATFEQARTKLAKETRLQPAAAAAVDLIESCAALNRDAALEKEHGAFARIAHTQAAASLVQLFISEQRVKGKARSYAAQARKLERIGVMGAGIMGGGIAFSSAVRGFPVLMKDIAPGALELGTAQAQKQLDKQVSSGRMGSDQAATILKTIRPQLNYAGFEQLDLVIEAVVENMDVKRRVFAELQPCLAPQAILASNTSSLSIATLAEGLAKPENFVGMHFFNPVPVMPLVEIVRGPRTSDTAVAGAVGFVGALGKTPIVVRDCPGFLVNRVFTAYLLGYFRALRDGADFRVLDRVMEEFGWPMGPAYLQDVIGLDTLLRVVEVISAGYGQRMAVDFPIAPELLVEQHRFGQKSGAGYYRYETDPKGRPKQVADSRVPELLATLQPRGPREFEGRELVERLMLPMIVEAALCLEESVADSAEAIDLACVLGLGFPRHAGGPLKYADWLGLQHVVDRCSTYSSLGPLYSATERMRDMARNRERYFI
jgi:3-hydroxyacyl-CoA dehydrogenase / enoyl-CoA hydratase / 3-hydroxybutyryl-CoA epimerase / enoyl-CoA isomerase